MLRKQIVIFTLLLLAMNGYAIPTQKFLDKAEMGDSKVRYYIYFDKYGNTPQETEVNKISNQMQSGDELLIKYYPNELFSLDKVEISPLPSYINPDTIYEVCIFPYAYVDTFTVQTGKFPVYFGSNGGNKYRIRLKKKPSNIQIGKKINLSEVGHDLIEAKSTNLGKLNKIFPSKGYSDKYNLYKIDATVLNPGVYSLEIYLISGKSAMLIDRIKALQVSDVISNPELSFSTDLSLPHKFPMEWKPELGCYEAIIGSEYTIVGVHYINIDYDYARGSWYFRQVPNDYKNKHLKYTPDVVMIKKERSLPKNLRARAGIAVFDKATEVRLISNFVMILSPEYYYSSALVRGRINPTLGLQIGGTGNQDLVVLLGFSVKLIEQSDFIFGFRFGRESAGEKWNLGRNFYFGASLDPGLFNVFRSSKKE